MKKLDSFESIHQRSFLCMVGAFRDLLEFSGHKYSYPFCLGISSEMGFCYGHNNASEGQFSYMASPSYSIQHAINNMCRVTNVWSETGRVQNKEKLKRIIKKYIDEDRPLLLEVESTSFFQALHIPTFTVNTTSNNVFRIGGHNVFIVGYDENEQTYTIIEALLQKSVKMSMETVLDSCVVTDCLMAPEGKWSVYYVPPVLPSEDYMVYQSLMHTVHQMKAKYRENKEFWYGLEGINRFFEDLVKWPDLMTMEELIRNLSILYDFERMGQGGGFLRTAYGQFLKEESESLKIEELGKVADTYFELGTMWSEFAEKIRILINDPNKESFKKVLTDKELEARILDKESRAIYEIENLL